MYKKEEYLSYAEIHKQHEQLRRTLDYITEKSDVIREFFQTEGDIVFVASGSSYWMSLSAHKTMKLKTGRNTYAVKAGDVLLCGEEFAGIYKNPIIICPSRSGHTSEVIEALKILRKYYPSVKVLSIVEYEDSPLEKLSDLALRISWANEKSVCQTRSFSCLYLASILIAGIASNNMQIFSDAERYLSIAPALYTEHGNVIAGLVNEGKMTSLVCLGCGLQYGVCIEGAYIVIEMAGFNTNYFQLLEYRHGPIATAGEGTYVFILSYKGAEEYEEEISKDAEKAGATTFVVSDRAQKYGRYTFSLGEDFSKEIVALHYVFCLQSLAFHLSIHRGKNPDRPGSLVPFIVLR